MKRQLVILLTCAAIAVFFLMKPMHAWAQSFIHPGLNQTGKDLAYMKDRVLKGVEPWKGAYDRLKASTDTAYNVEAYTHVLRGPYGKPNIGGNELSKGAGMAYDCALLWYITGDKKYADKAIAIIDAWSGQLWDFDYNDAKLLAAWTGHVFCNAAEILRHTNAGWKPAEIDRFTQMLMTVYYPLMRDYYPQANGNWDGAIIHSLIAMAVFTDNRTLFGNAVDHFLLGPVNGSIFKYIYPSGQCQESMRDQGHVQLGLGEFAGAAQIAYTQGVDLFSIADNRIALGYEYTAGFILGETPHCYGVISERAKALRDDYEYVYRHYTAQGIYLPNTKKAADSIRPKASRSILTATRVPTGKEKQQLRAPVAGSTGYIAGAGAHSDVKIPADAIFVAPGESIQDALNTATGTHRWVVAKKGIHTLPATLKMPSGVTLAGEGIGTTLFLDPKSGQREAIVNASGDMQDITIRDLLIEGSPKTEVASDPNGSRSFRGGSNRGGIIFRADAEGKMKNLRFIHLTIQNCTFNGLLVSGADDITITRCDFTENGSSVVPGPRLQHNLLLTHCRGIKISDSRMDTSPYGSGIALSACQEAGIVNCEIARNANYGILLAECKNITVKGSLLEGNNRGGIMQEHLYKGNVNIDTRHNIIHYNGDPK
ncbi:alginate lyase family protein [Chitinophaga sp. MM2321]|uniref:alginate lyase family protein n=1 Tax=Chitinophaga sp. MM2321 TaxID=3137178 RepID=UPI0032D574CD